MNDYVFSHLMALPQYFLPLVDGGKEPNGLLAPHAQYNAKRVIDLPQEWRKLKNFGIRLDNQYIVVDFDAEHEDRHILEDRLPKTWQQQTRKGMHYLYTVPEGFQGKNVKLRAKDGTFIGDLKVKGYIVCPDSVVLGHTYTLINAVDPIPAPEWLLSLAKDEQKTKGEDGSVSFDILPDGSRDDSLFRIASNLRSVGYNEDAITGILTRIVDDFVEQPEGREVEAKDIERIARSASKYETEIRYDTGVLLPEGIITGDDVEVIGPPTEWWLHGFVPKGELVMMFGKGGIGKSTFASWLAAKVTVQDKKFGILGVEESFERFVARSLQSGAARRNLLKIPNASQIVFPRDAQKLRNLLDVHPMDILFLDSVYTHFDSIPGLNAAERSRLALSSLAEIAQAYKMTIIGNFHENKAGAYLGSVEMENVGRVLLKFTRSKNKPLRVHVAKTNKRDPGYDLEFPGIETVIKDPTTGQVQMEYNESGVLEPESVVIAQDPVKIEFEDDNPPSGTPEFINVGDLEESPEEKKDRVLSFVDAHPEMTQEDICRQTCVSRASLQRWIKNRI